MIRRARLNAFTFINRSSRLLAGTALAAGLTMAASPAKALDALENPMGEQVVGGAATFDRPAAGTLNVHQTTQRAVINWDSFNIGEKAKTEFFQPNSSSLTVNRVTGNHVNPTQILGTLKANGRLMVLDRNGVLFGAHSRVDVNGIVASTGDVDTNAVMRGDSKLTLRDFGNGSIVNEGQISASEAGLVAFVAPNVSNTGVITAKMGRVALVAGGESATVDLYGDGLVELAPGGTAGKVLASNAGRIEAEGGVIQMSAAAAKDAVDSVINMDGIADVSSVTVRGGKIILSGGNINVSGHADASGTDGGSVKVLADDTTRFTGTIAARSGKNGGHGGTVEISGKKNVGYAGLVDTTAAQGKTGTLLIDPADLTLSNGLNGPDGLNDPFVNAQFVADTLHYSNVNLLATNTLTVGDDVDVSTWNDTIIAARFAALVAPAFSGITENDLTLTAPTVNIGHNMILGTGGLNVDATTLNLNGLISSRDTVGGATTESVLAKLAGNASTVNVQSNAARINQGMAFSKTGGTVNVAAGTYDEDLVISKSLTLNGAKAGIYAGASSRGTGETILTPHSPGIVVTADNTTVDGFTIDGADNGIFVNHADHVKLKNNIVKNSTSDAIYVLGSDDTFIDRNKVQNGQAAGIYIADSTNQTLLGNIIRSVAASGIRIADSSHVKVGEEVANSQVFSSTIDTANTGILVEDSDNVLLDKNLIDHITTDGIRVTNSNGTDTANGVAIVRNNIGHAVNGINVVDGDFAQLRSNTVQRVTGNGVQIDGSDNVSVTNNRSNIVGGDGFHVNNSNNLKLSANRAYIATGDGFDIAGSANASITDNFAGYDYNGVQQAVDNIGGNGFRLINTNSATVLRNMINGTKLNGIDVSGSSHVRIGSEVASDSTIFSNQVLYAANGIVLDGGTDNIINKNLISYITTDGIRVTNATGTSGHPAITLLRNNTQHGVTGLNVSNSAYASIRSNTVQSMSGNGIQVDGSRNASISGNRSDLVSGDGIHVTNGANSTLDGNKVYLTGADGIDIAGSAGVVVRGNFVGIDYANHSAGADNVQGDGIKIDSSDNASVRGNMVRDTKSTGVDIGSGIRVSNSTGVTIGGTGANANDIKNSGWDGIKLVGDDNATVTGNIVDNSARTNVYAVDTTSSRITNNVLSNAHLDPHGAVWTLNGGDFTITGNSVTGSTGDGIVMNGATGTNLIDNNTVTLVKRDGIAAFDVTGLTISFNHINGQDGIFATGGAGAGRDGIHVERSEDSSIIRNTIQGGAGLFGTGGKGAGRDGIFVKNSAATLIAGNDILRGTGSFLGSNGRSAVRDGVHVEDSSGIRVAVNHIETAGRHGVFVDPSPFAEINANVITNATLDGIHVADSDVVRVFENDVRDSGRDGIALVNSSSSGVSDNTIGRSARHGVSVTGGGDNSIGGNGIFLNGMDGVHAENTGAVYISLNDIAVSQRHGIGLFNTGFADVEYNNVALSGTNFLNWSFNGPVAPPPVFGILAIEASGTTLNFGNGDGIHIENAFGPGGESTEIPASARVLPGDGGSVNVIGNIVRWSGGDGIEVRDSGITEISDNNVSISGINSATVPNGTQPFSLSFFVTPDYSYTFADAGLIPYLNASLPPVLDIGYGNGNGINVRNTGFSGDYNSVDDFTGFADLDEDDYGVRIIGNTVDTTGGDGIEAYYSGWTEISGNTVTNAGQVQEAQGPTFTGDDVEDGNVTGDGIRVDNGGESQPENFVVASVTGNTVTNALEDGIHSIDVNRSLVSGNTVTFGTAGRGVNGIEIEAGAAPIFEFPNFTFFSLLAIPGTDFQTTVANNLTVDGAPQNGIVFSGQNVATLTGNVVTNAGANGLFGRGANNASVILSGNSVTGAPTGGRFESGNIDLTGAANSFTGGTVGLYFAPFSSENGFADMNLVGNTIGTTSFVGQTQYYVQLENGAFYAPGTPTLLDGTNASFDGLTPATQPGGLSDAQYDHLQDMLHDWNDDQTLGLFFLRGPAGPDDNGTGNPAGLGGTDLTPFDIAEEDIFEGFPGFRAITGGVRLTITGLPRIPGQTGPTGTPGGFSAGSIASIEPAAGGEETGPATPQDVASVEPSSGGSAPATAQSCWGPAIQTVSSGGSVDVNFGNSLGQNLSDAGCQ